MRTVLDPWFVATQDGYDYIIDSNFCVRRDIIDSKHTFSPLAKGWSCMIDVSLDLISQVTRKWQI